MRKNKFLLVAIVLLIGGQILIAKETFQGYEGTIRKVVYASKKKNYLVTSTGIWELVEVPKNASGRISTKRQDVNYLYKKINLKKWRKKIEPIVTPNKKMSIEKKKNFTGKGKEKMISPVASMMGQLSGKLSYGVIKKEDAEMRWFK